MLNRKTRNLAFSIRLQHCISSAIKKTAREEGRGPCGLGGGGNEVWGWMFVAKVAIALWPLPVGHRPLYALRWFILFRFVSGRAQDSVPPADRLRAALPLGTNRAP